MRPAKKNYRQSTRKVKGNFALCVQKLFTAELHGYKITNKTIINILTAPSVIFANGMLVNGYR